MTTSDRSPPVSPTAPASPAADPLDRLRIDRQGTGRRRRFPWGLAVTGLIVLLIAGAYVSSHREEWSAPKVRTGKVVRYAATEGALETTANGKVVARRRAAISSKLSGRLDELLVDVGDQVKSGQLLARLGHTDLDASVAQAKAELEVRRRRVETTRAERAAQVEAVQSAAARIPEMDATVAEMETRLADANRMLAMQERMAGSGASSRDAADGAKAERDVMTAQLARSRASLAAMKAEVERARAVIATADAQIASAQAEVGVSEAAVVYAQALRADADITAPFAGRVVRKEAEVGEMVAPVNAAGSTTRGAVVMLVDFASLEMEVDVVERDIAKVREGGTCRIVLDARRDHAYVGRVRQKLPTADSTKATFQVKIVFDALDEQVFPEMGGRVEFLAAGKEQAATAKDRVLGPAAAFTTKDGTDGLWVVAERRVKFVAASRGAAAGDAAGAADAHDGRVEITRGVSGGEDVVLDPSGLTDGALVRTE